MESTKYFFVIRAGNKPLSPFDGSYMKTFLAELIVDCNENFLKKKCSKVFLHACKASEMVEW